MAGPSELATYAAAARTAIAAGDIPAARVQISLMAVVLAEIPDSEGDGVGVRWSNSIRALELAVQQATRAQRHVTPQPGYEF